MKVPTLLDGPCVVFDSDHIAHYLVRKAGRDEFRVLLSEDRIDLWNARAVLNSVMQTETELVLAKRAGMDIHDAKNARFQKMAASIEGGVQYLESVSHLFGGPKISYQDFHLVSMIDHLVVFKVIPHFKTPPKLAKIVETLYMENESVRSTAIPPL